MKEFAQFKALIVTFGMHDKIHTHGIFGKMLFPWVKELELLSFFPTFEEKAYREEQIWAEFVAMGLPEHEGNIAILTNSLHDPNLTDEEWESVKRGRLTRAALALITREPQERRERQRTDGTPAPQQSTQYNAKETQP